MDNFAAEFDKKPSKNSDEKSYKTTSDTVVIYVPEEVCADLDDLRNKTVTIILGEDNIASIIIIEDDLVDTAFLTEYDADDEKIVVGGETYKLQLAGTDVARYAIEVNGDPNYTNLADALTKIDPDVDFDDIEKKIEATLTLNEDNKVELIELSTSAALANTAEVLVTKVKETSKAYTITTTGKNLTWDVDDEEDKDFDFPKVYIDGAKGDIRDIEAGNVLTIVMDPNCDNEVKYNDVKISKIYASTKAVTGEATRVKKANNAITVDGEVYTRSNKGVKVSTEELKENKFNVAFDSQDILDNDEVTLYLNVYGEYVAVSLLETESDYTFGVVTFVSSNTNWDGEEEDILTRRIKVLLADGKKTNYTVSVDTSDDDIDEAAAAKITTLVDKNGDPVKATAQNFLDEDYLPAVGEFIMFEATADNTIEIEDGSEIKVLPDDATAAEIGDDYILVKFAGLSAVSKNDEEFIATYTDKNNETQKIEAEYDAAETVIFNTKEEEIVTKWKSILDENDSTKFAANTFVIFADEDDDIPAYIVVDIEDDSYATSDAEYAVVEKSAYHEDDKYYVDLLDNEYVEIKDDVIAILGKSTVNSFIEYEMKSSKVSNAAVLVDVEEFEDLDAEDTIPAGIINAGFETTPVNMGRVVVNVVANTEAKDTGNWGPKLTAEGYAELYLEGFLPKDDAIKFTSENDSLAAYGDEFKDGDKYVKTIDALNTTSDQDLALLVKADGKVHTITIKLEYNNGTEDITEDYVIYASATIDAKADESAVASYEAVKENLTVAETKEYDDYIKITYKEFEDEGYVVEQLPSVKADKDAKVYDLRNGGCVELTIDDLVDLVEEEIIVIPFANNDCDDDAEANVFVIVD